MASEEAPLGDVLDELQHSGREQAVSIGDVLDAFQHRSLGVLLTLFGLLAALPIIGDIPGMSILLGTLILIVIAESLVGRGTLWMPGFVRRRDVSRERFDQGIRKARPWVEWVDRLLKPRLKALSARQRSGRVQHRHRVGHAADQERGDQREDLHPGRAPVERR